VSAAALVLAAGAGRRMGGPKALVEFDGGLLVERAVAAAVEGGCSPVFAVLGARAAEVRARARLGNALTVVNAGWAEGIGSSLRVGLDAARAAAPGADAALVLLVDQPFVGADAVRAVLCAWRDGARLAAASYAGRRGHPVLFGREHWTAVAADAGGDSGARGFLAARRCEVVLVPCDELARPDDLDTPGDLRRFTDRPPDPSGPAR
jgi:CTP:molybdopterin cytidylyltransferase MocA